MATDKEISQKKKTVIETLKICISVIGSTVFFVALNVLLISYAGF